MRTRDLAVCSAEEYTALIAPDVESLERHLNMMDCVEKLEGKGKHRGRGEAKAGGKEGEEMGGWI